MNFFPSRWPIMCAVMNSVSDLTLASAVHSAGAMPSLMIKWTAHDLLHDQLKEFVRLNGDGNCVLQLGYKDLTDSIVLSLVEQYQISHVELFGLIGIPNHKMQAEFDTVMKQPKYLEGYQRLKNNRRILTRIFTPSSGQGIDAYALKGAESAGFGSNISVKDLFSQQQAQTPDISLIPYGGIGTPEQVAWYIKHGAAGVAVGTLFAATQESCLSFETKTAMVKASSQDLRKLNTFQQALVLGDISQDNAPNRQYSLDQGIAGHGGLVYAGTAIDHVTKIRTVQEVVNYLTSEL